MPFIGVYIRTCLIRAD